MNLQESFVKNLKALRAKKKLSQDRLAHAAGVSTSFCSMLERGQREPSLGTIEALARALGVPARALLA